MSKILVFAALIVVLAPLAFAAPGTCDDSSFKGVCVVASDPGTGTGSASAAELANLAAKYVGRLRYVWGGTSLVTGADCSGFVQSLYQQGGVVLPRLASQQYRVGTPVEKSQLQPGDLVFFENTYKRGISHVGVFLQGCTVIHAPGTGKTVKYDDICSGYLAQHYAGARRVA
ncbi:hypothetical protein AUJ14_04415 [Candidatus Micrarchaeota archaeon CG1_02_55_22]|nr:MAG: hypothetical protein AUJ14_04415 [Candidatus Micrarchaeota archaeon CG1_02_55_22]